MIGKNEFSLTHRVNYEALASRQSFRTAGEGSICFVADRDAQWVGTPGILGASVRNTVGMESSASDTASRVHPWVLLTLSTSRHNDRCLWNNVGWPSRVYEQRWSN